MAGAIVDFVVGKLKEQAFQEVLFQWRIKDEVDKISARLANMKGYVEDSSGKGKQDTKVAESWVTQLRDTTLEVEDLVEEFMLDSKLVELNTPPFNFCEVKSLFANVQRLVERVKIQFCFHQQLKAMDEKLLALETEKSKYSIKLKTNDDGKNELLMGSGSGYMVGIDAVGIDKQVEDIAQLIQKRREQMLVITAWGAGGCGKTTLAKQVYERVVKDRSIDYCWWVDVNHSSDIEFVLRETINGLYRIDGTEMPSKLEGAGGKSLENHICDYLKEKRYVVFFDDVWDEELLSQINIPVHEESAIIITSRDKDIGRDSFFGATPHCVEVKPLELDIACNLFCKYAFPPPAKPEGNWPNETVKELGEALVKRCTGLPVAILAMARLMSQKDDNPTNWKAAVESLDYYSAESGSLKCVNRALLLSYNELPTHLKSCFLYCAMFPKTKSLHVKELIRMCIAEGFIAEHGGRALEVIAKDYLLQLNNRSLIQMVPTESIFIRRDDDEIKMHDLFRDVAGEVIRREMFAEIKLSGMHNTKLEWKQRRSLIFLKGKPMVNLEKGNMKKLRTLIIDGEWIIVNSLPQMLQNMKLLRVLVLQLLPIGVEELPNEVGDLIHLRYISLSDSYAIRHIPDSLERLHNLQTLDLRRTSVKSLPKSVSQLMQLRHLFGNFNLQVADIVFTSSQLQTLSGIVVNTIQARELVNLTQLTELDITFTEGEECWRGICDSVNKMTNLRSLLIQCQSNRFIEGDGMVWEFGNFSPPLYLEKLALDHFYKSVKFTCTLNYLRSINIQQCYVDGDFFSILEKLPSLVCLYIDPYNGKQLLCSDGSFPKLKKLEIYAKKLTKWEIGKGAMKYVESLVIRDCYSLEMVPEGLRELEYLKELRISHPSQLLVQGIRAKGSDRRKIKDISRVILQNNDNKFRTMINKLSGTSSLQKSTPESRTS
ncbi:disease resistance protein RPM1-like [Ipomoea triloba]|uniref:disease resistance protein RPM1-like n=1 Tax=Ipomoea triloba TaxID=35885 RepID=UPI00125E9E4B|nr:disease resistance protein RPM1-like [Ipomoea triloba]